MVGQLTFLSRFIQTKQRITAPTGKWKWKSRSTNTGGRVTEAKSISGDSVLVGSSLDAAKKAEFRTGPPKSKGILVFNFDSFSKCLKAGVVNEKAISIPKPQLGGVLGPGHLRITQNQSIVVHIVIDQDGNVISARTHSGHPFLRAPFLHSARAAKFPRTQYGPIKVKALLTYTLNPDGTIEF